MAGRCVRVLSDNTTALSCLSFQGTLRSRPLLDLTRVILVFCHTHSICLVPVFLAGALNTLADLGTRRRTKVTEWSLDSVHSLGSNLLFLPFRWAFCHQGRHPGGFFFGFPVSGPSSSGSGRPLVRLGQVVLGLPVPPYLDSRPSCRETPRVRGRRGSHSSTVIRCPLVSCSVTRAGGPLAMPEGLVLSQVVGGVTHHLGYPWGFSPSRLETMFRSL